MCCECGWRFIFWFDSYLRDYVKLWSVRMYWRNSVSCCSKNILDSTLTVAVIYSVTSQLQISELCSSEVIWNENNETVSVSIGTRSGMCGLLLTLSLFLYLSHFFTIFSHFSALSISSCFRCEGDSSWWTQLTTCYWPFVTSLSPLDRGRSAIWP